MRIRPALRPLSLAAGLALALTLSSSPARADDDCRVPADRWQSRDAVQQKASERGWTVQRLKVDDGCYELRATDAQGNRLKIKLDPETLEVVELKQKARKNLP